MYYNDGYYHLHNRLGYLQVINSHSHLLVHGFFAAWTSTVAAEAIINDADQWSYPWQSHPPKLSSTTLTNEAIFNDATQRSYHQRNRLPKVSSATPPTSKVIIDTTIHRSYHQRYNLMMLSLTKPLTKAIKSYHWGCCPPKLSLSMLSNTAIINDAFSCSYHQHMYR